MNASSILWMVAVALSIVIGGQFVRKEFQNSIKQGATIEIKDSKYVCKISNTS